MESLICPICKKELSDTATPGPGEVAGSMLDRDGILRVVRDACRSLRKLRATRTRQCLR